ncbi:MAG: site-specific integrase [Bacilli bacterium]|nr:site-specific integrase [Bacilli bacterium]MDD4283132.1 site-specific integrase [Bacilli bacterium]
MAVFKADKPSKDGKQWIFYTRYTDLSGDRKQYKSKKYATKKEALEGERQFELYLDKNINKSNMTFKDLYLAYYDYQKDKVKQTTIKTYLDRIKYLELLSNIKLDDLNIHHFETWKKKMYEYKNISNSYRNMIYKFLKAILNYGSKWYGFNFSSTYNKMTNFTDPNEIKPEMQFFTYDEFKRFIAQEEELKYRCLFKVLYYCGLRKGELRGLTWDNINFNDSTLNIRKNVVSNHITGTKYVLTTPKTRSSIRTVPIPKHLLEGLKQLYEVSKNIHGFKESYYVFGHSDPIGNDTIRSRKNNLCKKAKVKQIRIHDFRHSCASLLINSGANITLVAKYLGHAKIDETLNTYSHMYKNTLNSIVDIIDKLEKND